MSDNDSQNRIYVGETIEALKGKTVELKKALLATVPVSRQEKGCIYCERAIKLGGCPCQVFH